VQTIGEPLGDHEKIRTLTLTLSEDQYMRFADAVRARLDDLEPDDPAAAEQLDTAWRLLHDAWYGATAHDGRRVL
jgi:hypothetical protein